MTRIIAGLVGGRRIVAPKGQDTRPTTDRTKEALFSTLVSWFGTQDAPADQQFKGLTVLDLYAGSGAIGLEAASRGADLVVAIEAGRDAAAVITRNAQELALEIKVCRKKVETIFNTPATSFDLIFADPPYPLANCELETVLAHIASGGWLRPAGIIVIERSARSLPFNWPAVFCDTWKRQYGETVLYFGTTQPTEE